MSHRVARTMSSRRTVGLAGVLLTLVSAALVEAQDIPTTFQGSWRGTSCLADAFFATAPESIRDRLILRIGQSVLTVRPTSFTRTLSTLARMSEATEITASPIHQPLADVLRALNVATLKVLGVSMDVDPGVVLDGVTLQAGACQVGPMALVAHPGEGRPSGAAEPSKECRAAALFHYPDADHIAMPSDGVIPCLEIFERIP